MDVTTEISEDRKSVADLEKNVESLNWIKFCNHGELHLILEDLHKEAVPHNLLFISPA